ncbi:2-octaprenyl-6-methoxyphenyl hydroxylase [Thalassotalea maritima]|uniref:2-octaprenyl-6-methoxyphenyl hydroxylase n=1 Tax=Thalassotalea maritima TaxID=3242416 RepID=UPI003529655A
MDNNIKPFDVIISGAGLSGATMALALAKLQKKDGSRLSIAVIENLAIDDNLPSSFDARVIALANGSGQYLHQLNVWQHIQADAMAIETIHISDRGHYGKARMYAQDYDVNALGYVVEMQAIGNGLFKALKSYDNVQFFSPESITDITWQRDSVNVTLASNTKLQASLLIACDGAQSQCRQLAGIECDQYDYQQVAIIANVSTELAHQGRAFERFTDTGPIAMLPMTDNRSSLVWTVSPEQVDRLMALNDTEFATELQQAFGHYLGTINKVGTRFSFPLRLLRARESTYHRMALVGNASHTLHPIAGQGFNLGVRDVEQLVHVVANALAHDEDIGCFNTLQGYADDRDVDHQQVISLTDSLVHLFSNNYPPLALARGVGLKALNYLSPLKQLLAHKTMGHR